jgi:ribonuclease D
MKIKLHKNDLPDGLNLGPLVAIDTETMGLDPQRDRLCLAQLSAGDGICHAVQFGKGEYAAPNLKRLLADPKTTKLFHFARFDVAMFQHWLGVEISKEQQSSDWGADHLSEKQLAYAASDVAHLHALKTALDAMLAREGRTALAQACFDFLPRRAALDLAGWEDTDIFAH